jgi:DNA-directed RNA polymerase specialized sigma24 family protein
MDPLHNLDLTKLKSGDNEEWGRLLHLHAYRLRLRSTRFMDDDNWREDIVAGAIASTYSLRATFIDIEHLLNFMYKAIRYECLTLRKYTSRIVLDDGIAIALEEYPMSHPALGNAYAERLRWEDWQDRMLAMIREKSDRMPTRLKDFLLAWLDYGRQKFAARLRELGYENREQRVSALNRVRDIVRYNDDYITDEEKMENLGYELRKMTKRYREVILLAAKGRDIAQIRKQVGGTHKSVNQLFSYCSKKLSDVIGVPDIFYSHVDMVYYVVKGPARAMIVRELEAPRLSYKLSKDVIRETVLLRDERRMSWDDISAQLGYSTTTLKKAYVAFTGRKNTDVRKTIDLEFALKVRKMYKTGEYTQASLARTLNVAVHVITHLLYKGKWRYVEGGNLKPQAIQGQS